MSKATAHIVLETHNLSIGYTQALVNPITINLGSGQLVGLIGINGSGKSTLLKTLTGLTPPLSGNITLAGRDSSNLSAQERAQKLAVVLTKEHISGNLTVAELVALGRHPYTNWIGKLDDQNQEQVNLALQQTAITDLAHTQCHKLSDGQLQRVLIARALAQDTAIILLDEPLSHLDLHHKAAILKMLKTIVKEQQKTILFSSHDVEHILPVCDTLLVLKDQKCIMGTPQELISNKTLHSLFPTEHIRFDGITGSFTIE